MDASSFQITYRDAEGALHLKRTLRDVVELPKWHIALVRTPKNYRRQRHMTGFYWLASLDQLVAYESRLEMIVLMQLDYSQNLSKVVAQPFVLHCQAETGSFEHIPDFMVVNDVGEVTIVDVKPRAHVTSEPNQRAFKATRTACEEAGWGYSVQSELDPDLLVNLKWLSGFRRPSPFANTYALALVDACVEAPIPLEVLVRSTGPSYAVRPVLFQLLWHQQLCVDMAVPINNQSLVDLPRQAFAHAS